MRRGRFFYGDDGSNVDFAQRHAGSDLAGQGDTEQVVKAARRNSPRSVQNDPVKSKRLDDSVRESMAGYDTTPLEDARLRQESPTDEYMEQAERMTRGLEQGPGKHRHFLTDPGKRREYVESLAEMLRNPNGDGQPKALLEKEEKPFSNEFWNNPDELQKVAKQVRPRRL